VQSPDVRRSIQLQLLQGKSAPRVDEGFRDPGFFAEPNLQAQLKCGLQILTGLPVLMSQVGRAAVRPIDYDRRAEAGGQTTCVRHDQVAARAKDPDQLGEGPGEIRDVGES
jgi:hypothetical protein